MTSLATLHLNGKPGLVTYRTLRPLDCENSAGITHLIWTVNNVMHNREIECAPPLSLRGPLSQCPTGRRSLSEGFRRLFAAVLVNNGARAGEKDT